MGGKVWVPQECPTQGRDGSQYWDEAKSVLADLVQKKGKSIWHLWNAEKEEKKTSLVCSCIYLTNIY